MPINRQARTLSVAQRQASRSDTPREQRLRLHESRAPQAAGELCYRRSPNSCKLSGNVISQHCTLLVSHRFCSQTARTTKLPSARQRAGCDMPSDASLQMCCLRLYMKHNDEVSPGRVNSRVVVVSNRTLLGSSASHSHPLSLSRALSLSLSLSLDLSSR